MKDKIIKVKLPYEIVQELKKWKLSCDLIKNHPLSYLKKHENLGSNFNHYQVSVPSNLIENSFWLAYTLRLCGDLFDCNHREFYLAKWKGHFDGYDLWINYSYKGNSNPLHIHNGFLSGVIYLNNQNDVTIFPSENCEVDGQEGDMILFSSNLQHMVNEQQKDYERVTFAFNILRKDGHR